MHITDCDAKLMPRFLTLVDIGGVYPIKIITEDQFYLESIGEVAETGFVGEERSLERSMADVAINSAKKFGKSFYYRSRHFENEK